MRITVCKDDKGYIYRKKLVTWDEAVEFGEENGLVLLDLNELCEIPNADLLAIPGVLAGYRDPNGMFYSRGSYAYVWSSSVSGTSAWLRSLYSSYAAVSRGSSSKAFGFSAIYKQRENLFIGKPAYKYGLFTDPRDGHHYRTIKIGKQEWMRDNLAYQCKGAYRNPDGEENYGLYYVPNEIYDWKYVAPPGWHIATDSEWEVLENYLDASVGFAITGWRGTDIGTRLLDPDGFAGVLAGLRLPDGSFDARGTNAHVWSSSDAGSSAWLRYLNSGNATVLRFTYSKELGFSARCVRDVE